MTERIPLEEVPTCFGDYDKEYDKCKVCQFKKLCKEQKMWDDM